MPASVRWDGLDELKAYLRTLPAELAGEASAIVASHARAAQQEVQAAYPVVTGRLRADVRVTLHAQTRWGAGAVVKSAAPHAWIYEHGTKPRKVNKRGEPSSIMPPAPPDKAAIPKFIRWRTRMYAQLAAMVERHGLRVSGSIGRAA